MRCGWKSMRLNNEYLSQWVGKTASNTTWITRKCSVDSRKIYEWKKMRKNIMNAGDGFLTWLFMNAQACAYRGQRFARFVPIWSVAFEAIVFKIKTNQKGLSFFYFAILKIHVEMVWFGLFSLWNRTALLLFILIFCGLKSITKYTDKMRLGNCKWYKRSDEELVSQSNWTLQIISSAWWNTSSHEVHRKKKKTYWTKKLQDTMNIRQKKIEP